MTRTLRRRATVGVVGLTTALVALVGGLSTATAHSPTIGVLPASFSASGIPGATFTVNKVVHTPAIPAKLDFVLDVDNSGSYGDDKPTIVALAPGLATALSVLDTQFGLTTFVDFPFSPWGDATFGDYAYQRDLNLTASTSAWTTAISAMIIRFGGDGPESQYESLYQAATGAGRDVPPAGPSLGDIPAGQGITFRSAATKVIAITTDAPFHTNGDSSCTLPAPPCPFPYPGPTAAATITALTGAGIKVIALKAPGSGSEMDALALATGGSVHTTSSSSAGIAAAILAGLGNLPVTVMPSATCDPGLSITFSPTGPVTVTSGDDVAFTETISVSVSATPGSYSCTVDFLLDGNTAAGFTQSVSIDVVPGPPASLVLTPATDTNTVDDTHCVTATVRDAFGNLVSPTTVNFAVTGSVATTGSSTTLNGTAQFCYTGPALPGADLITATAQGGTNPSDTATKTWVIPASTAGCKVTYGGRITAANGDKATFGGNAKADGLSGQEEYQDHGPALNINVHSIDVLSVECSLDGTEASIFGTATIDGSGTFDYRIDLKDLGEPGDTDTYRIRLSNGYDSDVQVLEGGNVQIH